MLKDLLKSKRVATLEEFRYVLNEVLSCDRSIPYLELYFICQKKSINLELAFVEFVEFLESLKLIQLNEEKAVLLNCDEFFPDIISDPRELPLILFSGTIESLKSRKILTKIFNSETITYDVQHDSLLLHFNRMPLDFPMIKSLLLNLELVDIIDNNHTKVVVKQSYKSYFREQILLPSVSGEILQLSISEQSNPQKNDKFMNPSKTIFISYARKDEEYKIELVKHLSGLRDNGLISDWNDRVIQPGSEWDKEIKENLKKADIILFLVSADFMYSGYIKEVELQKALQRYEEDKVIIIPVIVRACDFSSLNLSKFQALPKDAKAVASWVSLDEAFLDVVNGLKRLLQKTEEKH